MSAQYRQLQAVFDSAVEDYRHGVSCNGQESAFSDYRDRDAF